MWSILLGLGGSLVQWFQHLRAEHQTAEWISMAACGAAIFIAFKVTTSMLEFLTSVFKNKWCQWVGGGLLILSSGFALGHYNRGSSGAGILPPGSKAPSLKEVPVQKADAYLRSKAYIIDGKTYYNSNFINKYLKFKGANIEFKDFSGEQS